MADEARSDYASIHAMRSLSTEPAPPVRNLKIAFAGASATGKSTLAEFVAQRFDLPLCPVGARSVAKALGFQSPYDVDQVPGARVKFQQQLLHDKFAWESSQTRFVTDRTPLDNLAYVLMHASAADVTAGFLEVLEKNVAFYTHVFFCPIASFQSHIPENDPYRVASPTYHLLYEAALRGLLEQYVPKHKLHVVTSSDALLRRTFVDTVLV